MHASKRCGATCAPKKRPLAATMHSPDTCEWCTPKLIGLASSVAGEETEFHPSGDDRHHHDDQTLLKIFEIRPSTHDVNPPRLSYRDPHQVPDRRYLLPFRACELTPIGALWPYIPRPLTSLPSCPPTVWLTSTLRRRSVSTTTKDDAPHPSLLWTATR